MRTLNFAKRNFIEMARDPVIYIFCAGFPVAMLAMFTVIGSFSGGATPVFELRSLIPGVMTFSFSFVTLLMSLLVSRDRTTALLTRLYTSPMTKLNFVVGYAAPAFVVGLAQEILCLLGGLVIALITGTEYFSFASAVLLAVESVPMLVFVVSAGILLGTLLNDKTAPGVASVFITASGILGGAWMPLDSMGALETFCRFLPFYPSVYLGRVITGANHSVVDYTTMIAEPYRFDAVAQWGIPTVLLYTAAFACLAVVAFGSLMRQDKK